MKRILMGAGLVLTLLLILPVAPAQSIFANLTGTVTDAGGAVIPGAAISVQNASSKVTRTAATDSKGFFSLTQLPSGTYNIFAQASGFQKYAAHGMILNSSDSKTIDITLKVGAATETVEVNATDQQLATIDSGEKSALISSKELNQLSLVGRNATEFLKILPGATLNANGAVNKLAYTGEVVGINGFAVNNNAGGLSGVNVNGQSVAITQDGQNTFDPGAAGAATPVNPNPDMISEVKVMTSNFTAENAKGPVVVNTVTKSGGSTFHGDVHFYARNSTLNSEDAFNKAAEAPNGYSPGQLKGPSEYYYPGFTIGGPVLIPGTRFNKDRKKYFFFESYENYHQLIDGGINRAFVPTAAMLNGDFSGLNQIPVSQVKSWHGGINGLYTPPTAPAAGQFVGFDQRAGCTINNGVLSQQCIDPNAQLLMKAYFPAPTSATLSDLGFNYVSVVSERQNSYQNVVRGDVDITDNTKAYVSWSRQRETANMPLGLWNNSGDWVVPAPSATIGNNASDFTAMNFVHIFSPKMTMEARFGYTKISFPSSPADPSKLMRKDLNFPLTGIFGNSNTPAFVSWGSAIPNLGDIGHDYHPTMIADKGIPSAGADLTKVFGTHTTKYGFYYEHTYNKQDNWGQFMGVLAYYPGSGSTITGNNYSDMLMGIGQGGYNEQALPPPTNLAQNIAAFYAQDDWKFSRRITIQYGMRFEHYAKPYADNPWGIAVFDPTKYSAGTPNAGISWHSLDQSIPLSGTNSRFLFFSPRIGAAIDLYGNGMTVLRGGWGKYRAYDSVQSNSYTGPAQTSQGSASWGCGFNDKSCPTWEAIDTHASGNCTAGFNCAPTVVFGQPTAFANTTFSAMSPKNDEQPVTTSYSLTIDQQMPARFQMELSYVGNHTDFMQGTVNINAVPLGTLNTPGFTCPVGSGITDPTCQQAFRPYSQYQGITQSVTAGKAQFDSMQASIRRNVGLLTMQANYTWSKALGDGVAVNNGGLSGALPDWGVREYWSVLPQNRGQAFSAAYVFTLPKMMQGNAFVRSFTNGWQFSGITQVQSGAMLTATGGQTSLNFGITGFSAPSLLGTPDINVYPVLTCDPTTGLQKHQFLNPNCFALPSTGNIGNGRLPSMPGPAFWNSDATLLKNFSFKERQNVEVRFAAFNFLNHDLLSFTNGDSNLKLNFASDGTLTNATDTQHPCPGPSCGAFGYADYHYGHRILEFGMRYSF